VSSPETRYARAGDVHVAYQVVGSGPPDLVLVSTWFSHVEARWDFPGFAHYLRRLASFSRLISFDKRGIGLSDPVSLDRLPLLEEWMDDVRTVMDDAGSDRAVVMGANEGSMMAALFAATFPDRVTGLVLANATARPAWAHDNPLGIRPDVIDAFDRDR
jgi:pimeloyl-ACP methyl ester carboxylesterase